MALLPEDLFLTDAEPALAAKAWGPVDGDRVLALHGWLDNAATFDLTAPALVSAGMRVVALDLPGHGLSGHRPGDTGYQLADYAYDVDRAARALGWERFKLLGHSLGAAVSCLYAGVFPEKVRKVAAIEGLAPLTARDEELPERLAMSFAARVRAAERGKRFPVYSSVAAALETRMAAGEFPVGDWIEGVVRRGLVARDGGFSWRSDPKLRLPTGMRLTPGQALALLGKIVAPVLFVRARQGIAADMAAFAAAINAVQKMQVYEVDGGHHVHLEKAGEIGAVVAAFLRGD